MIKKISCCILLSSLLVLNSCGTLLKPGQINKSHSDNLDITIVVLNSLGLLFLIPGIVAFAIDHNNGTLYLPAQEISLENISESNIQKTLVDNGYNVSLSDVKKAIQTPITNLQQMR